MFGRKKYDYHVLIDSPSDTNWGVCDDGFIVERDVYSWDKIRYARFFNVPKTPLLNGMLQVNLKGKDKFFSFRYRDKEKAKEALEFIRKKIGDD